jgi:hypothetical protein
LQVVRTKATTTTKDVALINSLSIWSPPPQHLQIIKMEPKVVAKAFDTADVYQDQAHNPYL